MRGVKRRVLTAKQREALAIKQAMAEEGVEDETPQDAIAGDDHLLTAAGKLGARPRQTVPAPELIPVAAEETHCCVVFDGKAWRTAWVTGLTKQPFGDPFKNAKLACAASMAVNAGGG